MLYWLPKTHIIFSIQVTGVVPDMSVVRAILKITWASAAGQVHLITSSLDEIEKATERPPTKPPDPEDLQGELLWTFALHTCTTEIRVSILPYFVLCSCLFFSFLFI